MTFAGDAVRGAASRGAGFWMLGVEMSMLELDMGLDLGLDINTDGKAGVPRGDGFKSCGGRQ